MKRLIVVLSVVCLFALVIIFSLPRAVIILTKNQLEGTFINSQVSIGNCVFNPLLGLSIFNIEIKKEGSFDIRIKEADVDCDFRAILKTGFLKLHVRDSVISLNTPKKAVNEFANHLKAGKAKPIFKSIEISNLTFDIDTLDLTAKMKLDSKIDLSGGSIDYLELKADNLSMLGLSLEDALLKLGPLNEGQVNIVLLKYDKLAVTDIKGKIKLQGNVLSAHNVEANALQGTLQLDLSLKFDQELSYSADLRVLNIDIEKFVSDFKFDEKFNMSGDLSGNLKIKGRGLEIEDLDGNFSTSPAGGVLIIKDTKYLEDMARSSSQPLSLLVENFKDYRYNIGTISLEAQGSDIALKVSLQGEAGKRELEVIAHDTIGIRG